MNIDDLTIKQIKQIKNLDFGVQEIFIGSIFIGSIVIVRTYSAGDGAGD